MPFSGLAPSKLNIFSTEIKGRLCVHREIVLYHFQYGPQKSSSTNGQAIKMGGGVG